MGILAAIKKALSPPPFPQLSPEEKERECYRAMARTIQEGYAYTGEIFSLSPSGLALVQPFVGEKMDAEGLKKIYDRTCSPREFSQMEYFIQLHEGLAYNAQKFSDLPFYEKLGHQEEQIQTAIKSTWIGTFGFHLLLGAYFLELGVSQQLISPVEDSPEDIGEQEIDIDESSELTLRKNYQPAQQV